MNGNDKQAAQPAAAQEAVARPEPYIIGNQYRTQAGDLVRFVAVHNEGTRYECMEDEAGVNRYTRRDFGRVTGTCHEYSDPRNTPPLYAAPVAAAPVGVSRDDAEQAIGEVVPMPGTAGFGMVAFKAEHVPVGTKLYAAPVAAAPGIDHLRSVINALSRNISDAYETACQNGDERMQTVQNARQSLLNTIREALPQSDTSPKGGSTDAWRSMDAAPKSAADGNRVEGVYLLGFIPDDDLADPQACIDVIWWEPLLPNSKGGRGKWCANRYSEACEVAPTKWQHLPNVQATSAEVGP